MSLNLDHMNAAQRQAITADLGPILVIAGPGSGKTRVLTYRIAYLIEEMELSPNRIIAVTFTNKAANEMHERVDKLMGRASRGITLGTFHSIFARILRREIQYLPPYTDEFVIFDTNDQQNLMKSIFNALDIDSKRYSASQMLNRISNAKNELISPKEFANRSSYQDELVARLYPEYMKALQRSNAMDFDDLLMNAVRLFQQNPEVLDRYHHYYSYILIDEFQDTNIAQYQLMKLLASKHKNVLVVGDPDQSIYAFRGADYRNIGLFRQEFEPQEIFLKENYRSHQYILNAAMSIIRKNSDHIRRDLYSQRQDGPKLVIYEAYDERDEAHHIAAMTQTMLTEHGYDPQEIAVMFRINAQSRSLEEAFIRLGLPYSTVGTIRFYNRREIKDILSYLRFIYNPNDLVSLERIINVPTRGIGQKTYEAITQWAEKMPNGMVDVLEAVHRGGETPLSGRARTAVAKFTELFFQLREFFPPKFPLEIIDEVIDVVGYIAYVKSNTAGTDLTDRLDNIEELRRLAAEEPDLTLGEFLAKVSLVADIDMIENGRNAVKLMTLHAAKGLEYNVVFLCALEEDILPHWRSKDDPSQLAEERRLMYVGITRAKERLYLSYAYRRFQHGGTDITTPSRFLADLPEDIIDTQRSMMPPKVNQARQSAWAWDDDDDFEFNRPTAVSRAPRPQPKPTTFQAGQRVYHAKYGEGMVIDSTRYGDAEEVQIQFEEYGIKRIDGNFIKRLD